MNNYVQTYPISSMIKGYVDLYRSVKEKFPEYTEIVGRFILLTNEELVILKLKFDFRYDFDATGDCFATLQRIDDVKELLETLNNFR